MSKDPTSPKLTLANPALADATPAGSTPAESIKEASADAGGGEKPIQRAGRAPEFGGPSGPEPTRYGDWERNGRVSDF